ncbi:MAG: ATP-binding cassette domain-containing protein [Herpetosiphon sp.]
MHVSLINLAKHFGPVRAVDGISVDFAAGQIHAVLGENGAGKSTLMKLLSGFLRRDSGETHLDGKPVEVATCADALAAGIGMVHQEPLDIPAFTVLENFICAGPPGAMPSLRAARRQLESFGRQLGFHLDPDAQVGALTIGQRQQLEIVRLLALGVKLLILDEPTTGISADQRERLFSALRTLADQGKTVLFVSHKIEEVNELCDTVTVLRAGQVQGRPLTLPQSTATLLTLMFGPLPPTVPPIEQPDVGAPFWELVDAGMRRGNLQLRHLDLTVRRGRCIGLAGLEGSGQQLLLDLLAGLRRPTWGRIKVDNVDFTACGLPQFLAAGVHLIPADRARDGMIGSMTLAEHWALTREHGALVDYDRARSLATAAILEYNIKGRPESPVVALSGGNQQRAMLALVSEETRGLLLEQPTRGLDVVSALQIWKRLKQRQLAGLALVFASPDLDELLTYSDDLLVFFGGRVSRLLPRQAVDSATLAELIGGVGFEAVCAGHAAAAEINPSVPSL